MNTSGSCSSLTESLEPSKATSPVKTLCWSPKLPPVDILLLLMAVGCVLVIGKLLRVVFGS